jgi:hypothetical protein
MNRSGILSAVFRRHWIWVTLRVHRQCPRLLYHPGEHQLSHPGPNPLLDDHVRKSYVSSNSLLRVMDFQRQRMLYSDLTCLTNVSTNPLCFLAIASGNMDRSAPEALGLWSVPKLPEYHVGALLRSLLIRVRAPEQVRFS